MALGSRAQLVPGGSYEPPAPRCPQFPSLGWDTLMCVLHHLQLSAAATCSEHNLDLLPSPSWDISWGPLPNKCLASGSLFLSLLWEPKLRSRLLSEGEGTTSTCLCGTGATEGSRSVRPKRCTVPGHRRCCWSLQRAKKGSHGRALPSHGGTSGFEHWAAPGAHLPRVLLSKNLLTSKNLLYKKINK